MGSPDELWIAAWHNSRVKKVDLATGALIDVCGTGKRGFAGNGGPAAAATLDLPVAVVFDAARQPADRRSGEPDDPQGRPRDRRSSRPSPAPATAPTRSTRTLRAQRRRARDRRPAFTSRSARRRRPAGASRSAPTAPSTSPTPTTSGCGASTRRGSSPRSRARALGLRRRRRARRGRAARAGRRRRGRPGRPRLHRRQRQRLRARRDARRNHRDVRRALCGQPGFAGDDGPATAALLDRPSGVEVGRAGRDLHRRHPQPAHPRRLSAAPNRRTRRPETELHMRDPNAGKSHLRHDDRRCRAPASLALVATHGDAQRLRRPVLQRAARPIRSRRCRSRRTARTSSSRSPRIRPAARRRCRRTSRSCTPATRRSSRGCSGRRGARRCPTGTDRLFSQLAHADRAALQDEPRMTEGTCIPQPISGGTGGSFGTGARAPPAPRAPPAAAARRRRRQRQLPGRGRTVRRRRDQVRRSDELKTWLTDNGYVDQRRRRRRSSTSTCARTSTSSR